MAENEAKKKSNTEMLLVMSKVKKQMSDNGCFMAGDALDGLNGWVYWLIEQATKRAKENKRKTVRAHDFMVL